MTQPNRVLLINPPIVDVRLPWAEWIEPTGLLKIGAALQAKGTDVRLLDCFRGNPKRRELQARIERGGHTLYRWRYGMGTGAILSALRSFRNEGWAPESVYVTSLASFWWIEVPAAVQLCRQIFPEAQVILGGKYAEMAYQHAVANSQADFVEDSVDGVLVRDAKVRPPALELYDQRIQQFSIADVAAVGLDATFDSIDAAVRHGATRLLLADADLTSSHPHLLDQFLERLASVYPRTRLHVLGAIAAGELKRRPEIALKLREARCRQLILADNRFYPLGTQGEDAFLSDVAAATVAAQEAGYAIGTAAYGVEVSVGRPGEPPEHAARLVARLAHLAGSVIPVPYQPVPGHPSVDDPWEGNGKLFPFAEANGSSFMEYMELLGLCSIVNAKYRDRTFDFMGEDSLIARSVQRSLRNRAWDPHRSPNTPDLLVMAPQGDEVA